MSNRRCAMRFPRVRRAPSAGLLLAAALLAASADPAAAAPLSREAVDEAGASLRDIPTLVGTRRQHELQFKLDEKPREPRPDDVPAWLRWLRRFFDWLNDAGRWLVWLLGAVAVAVAAVRIRVLLLGAGGIGGRDTLALPTHVQNLDIRPETLPDDIGGAALALWQQGDVAAAMSLLYRGALSRLVHQHGVAIRASSTEGDCLRLAGPQLAPPAQQYLQALVGAWRQTVYGAHPPAFDQGRLLCDGFAPGLAR
jgi:hypothetical protein